MYVQHTYKMLFSPRFSFASLTHMWASNSCFFFTCVLAMLSSPDQNQGKKKTSKSAQQCSCFPGTPPFIPNRILFLTTVSAGWLSHFKIFIVLSFPKSALQLIVRTSIHAIPSNSEKLFSCTTRKLLQNIICAYKENLKFENNNKSNGNFMFKFSKLSYRLILLFHGMNCNVRKNDHHSFAAFFSHTRG